MKKTRIFALVISIICLCFSAFTIAVLAENNESLKGDVNGDGHVNSQDVIVMRNYFANLDYKTGISSVEINNDNANMNGDQDISLHDLYLLRKFVVDGEYDTGEEEETIEGETTEGVETGVLSAPTTDTVGKKFSPADQFMASNDLSDTPLTYEAWIKLPESFAANGSNRGGVILGNYYNNKIDVPAFSFEIDENANPKLYYLYKADTAVTVIFKNVKVNTNSWLHLSIVNDVANEKLLCYVDGELKQEIAYSSCTAAPNPVSVYSTPVLGNDLRPTTPKHYFKGEIHSVAVYNDVRTAEEIMADKSSYGKDGLIAAWDVSGGNAAWVEDASGNGYDISLPKIFSTEYATTALVKNLSLFIRE